MTGQRASSREHHQLAGLATAARTPIRFVSLSAAWPPPSFTLPAERQDADLRVTRLGRWAGGDLAGHCMACPRSALELGRSDQIRSAVLCVLGEDGGEREA